MNRIQRFFGSRDALERAWAETQRQESPETISVETQAEAAEAMEALRQAFLASEAGKAQGA